MDDHLSVDLRKRGYVIQDAINAINAIPLTAH